MSIFKQIRDSLYNPKFFRGLLEKPLSFSVIYYLKFITILALVFIISFSLFFVKDINTLLWRIKPTVLALYPSDLVISIDKGLASINQPEPYLLPLPVEFNLYTENQNRYQNLLVIDTKATSTKTALADHQTLLFLASSTLFFDDSNKQQEFPLTDITQEKIASTTIASWFDQVEPWYKLVVPVLVFGLFILMWVLLALVAVWLLILSLLSWVLLRFILVDKTLTWGDAFKVTIHASTLPLLTAYLLIALNLPLGIVFFSVITLLIVWFNFSVVASGEK